ncbi:MAG: polymer-forming cytoskeletal protein, partial [Deltaproteobacteria bacterium]
MGFTDFRGRGNRRAKPETQPDDVRSAQPATTHLDQGCRLSGKLRFAESVHIEGRIEGEIESRKTLIIGEAAQVKATVRADSVVIRGQVKGDVFAARKITLHATAHVHGDMRTAGIVVEEGARVEGRILIGSEETAAPAKKAPPQRTQPAD